MVLAIVRKFFHNQTPAQYLRSQVSWSAPPDHVESMSFLGSDSSFGCRRPLEPAFVPWSQYRYPVSARAVFFLPGATFFHVPARATALPGGGFHENDLSNPPLPLQGGGTTGAGRGNDAF